MEYDFDRPESEMTCHFSNSRAPGGFAAYDIDPNEAFAKRLQRLPVTHLLQITQIDPH